MRFETWIGGERTVTIPTAINPCFSHGYVKKITFHHLIIDYKSFAMSATL